MTTAEKEAVERVARVICLSHGQDPDEIAPTAMLCGPENGPCYWWEYYEEQARAALSAMVERDQWQDISTAPKDGTAIIACRTSRYSSEQWFGVVWWQPEFDAFIARCNEMRLAASMVFADTGKRSRLHSPDIPGATHWLCVLPAFPQPPEAR